MTPTQKRLRDLRERQSKERGRLAELSLVDELNDEQRGELDNLEKGTPDLERQLRAATVALEDEEREAETRAVNEPDAEHRERIELRSKAKLTAYFLNAARGRMADAPSPNCKRRRVSAATGFRSNCGTFRLSAATAKASAKHARSLRRPEQPESISIRFARPCLPIPLRRAWGSKCRV